MTQQYLKLTTRAKEIHQVNPRGLDNSQSKGIMEGDCTETVQYFFCIIIS